jgi:hypothetical protein
MPYTPDSPIVGSNSAVSPDAIDAWLAQRGRQAAPTFAPLGVYHPIELPFTGAEFVRWEREWGADRAIAAAQMAHESAAGQSYIFLDKKNPAGLGAINSNPSEGAVRFEFLSDGIRAQMAHLMAYARGSGPWMPYDPRWQAVVDAGWLGVAPTLRGLNRRWAFPGTRYADAIAELSNDLERFAAGYVPVPRPQTSLPLRWSHIPWSNRNRDGGQIAPATVIWHDTGNPNAGANAEMHRRFTHNGGGEHGVSFHWSVDDREAIQLLPHVERGYHALEPCNSRTIAVEICIASDLDWERVFDNAAKLGAYIEAVEGRELVHQQHHDCTGKNCPGRIRREGRWNEFVARIASYRGVQPQPPPPTEDAITFPPEQSPFVIVRGFKGFWEELSGYERSLPFRVLGYPTSDEWGVPGLPEGQRVSYQRFQRGILKWSEVEPPPYHIHLALLDEHAVIETERHA